MGALTAYLQLIYTTMTKEEILKEILEDKEILKDYVNNINELENLDLESIIHTLAEYDDNVINYHKAHVLVKDSSSEEQSNAENELIESEFKFESYDDTASQIAFIIVRERLSEQIREELEEIKEELEEKTEKVKEELQSEIDETLDFLSKL